MNEELRTLVWVQQGQLGAEFHLLPSNQFENVLPPESTPGDVPIGTLRWERLHRYVEVESGTGKWLIQRQLKEVLGGRVKVATGPIIVKNAGTETEIARVTIRGSGNGLIEFSDGQSYQWKRAGWSDRSWLLALADGTPLFKIDPKFKLPFAKATGAVRVEQAAENLPQFSLLAILALFLFLRHTYDPLRLP